MNKRQRRQQGFTLIEIIAVIILLGVLAATIVPKFNDLTTEAKAAAAKQAVAEGIARANAAIAKGVLAAEGTVTWADVSGYLPTAGEASGDYFIAYANSGGTPVPGVTISAWTGTGAGAASDAQTGVAAYPE